MPMKQNRKYRNRYKYYDSAEYDQEDNPNYREKNEHSVGDVGVIGQPFGKIQRYQRLNAKYETIKVHKQT